MATKRTETRDARDWQNDPRLQAAVKRFCQLKIEREEAVERLQETDDRLQHLNVTLDGIDMRILNVEATEADATALRALRSKLELERASQLRVVADIERRRDAFETAVAQIRASAQAEATRARIVAFKPIVDEMRSRLIELSKLNDVLAETWEQYPGVTGVPTSIPELRIVSGSGRLFHWLKEADTFDWDSYGS
jgi:hypothetical protein